MIVVCTGTICVNMGEGEAPSMRNALQAWSRFSAWNHTASICTKPLYLSVHVAGDAILQPFYSSSFDMLMCTALQYWTDDRLQANFHRVSNECRYACHLLAFFQGLNCLLSQSQADVHDEHA